MKRLTFLLFTLCILISCKYDPNKQIDEGTIKENIYHSDEIGWTIEIPSGWNITPRSTLDERAETSLDVIQESSGTEFKINELKKLLNLQKDEINGLQSSSEPFVLEYEGQWEENFAAMKELIFDTYLYRGIETDSTETKIVEIDGLQFHNYQFTIYGHEGDVILNQLMYGSLINGFDFGININYNNESDKIELINALNNSKFVK